MHLFPEALKLAATEFPSSFPARDEVAVYVEEKIYNCSSVFPF